jgi:hypothetical protein
LEIYYCHKKFTEIRNIIIPIKFGTFFNTHYCTWYISKYMPFPMTWFVIHKLAHVIFTRWFQSDELPSEACFIIALKIHFGSSYRATIKFILSNYFNRSNMHTFNEFYCHPGNFYSKMLAKHINIIYFFGICGLIY